MQISTTGLQPDARVLGDSRARAAVPPAARVPAAERDEFVKDYAARMALNAPLSIAAAKITVNELIKNPDDRDIAACDAAVEACYLSHDYVEGQKAFGEKRPPEFKGQ